MWPVVVFLVEPVRDEGCFTNHRLHTQIASMKENISQGVLLESLVAGGASNIETVQAKSGKASR